MSACRQPPYRIGVAFGAVGDVVAGRLFGVDGHGYPYRRSPVSYATAYADGACTLEIHVDEDIGTFSAWPSRRILGHRVDGRRVELDIAGPGHMVVEVNRLERLLLTVSPPIPPIDASRGTVVHAAALGIMADAGTLATAQINMAIAELSRQGGGTLVFAPGLYRTGTVVMGSGVFIRLEAGAVLLGSENPADYPEEPEDLMAKDLPRSLIPGSRRALIYCAGIEDAGIEGAGMVCGNGSFLRAHAKRRPLINLVRAVESRNLRFDGVYLADSEFWSVHLILCDDISFVGTKIVSEIPPSGWDSWLRPGSRSCWNNADGINPDSSRKVRVAGCLIHTGDDCLPVKNTGTRRNELRDCEDIAVRNCLMITSTTALKIGTESRGEHVRKIRFEGIDVHQASRVIGVDMKDGAEASDIVFRDIRVALCNRPLDIWVIPREDQVGQKHFSRIRDIRIEGLDIRQYMCEGSGYESHVHGHSEAHDVRRVVFVGMRIAGQSVASPPQFHIHVNGHAHDVVFDG